MRTILMVTALAGCSTGYHPKSLTGGYSDSDIGGGRHSIDVEVNGYTSSGTALEYAYRRAGELCPSGYDVVNSLADKSVSYAKIGDSVQQVNKPEVALIVQCHDQADSTDAPHGEPPDRSPQQVPVEDEQQTPAQRKIVVGDAPLWCTAHAANLMSGNCEKTKEMCETMRAQLGSGDLGECVALGAVACFNYTDVMSTRRGIICTPSISDCDKQLAWDREHFAKDWKVSANECGIYRVKDAGSGGE